MKWFKLIFVMRKELMFWLVWFLFVLLGIDLVKFFEWGLSCTLVAAFIRFIMMVNNWESFKSYELEKWKETYYE